MRKLIRNYILKPIAVRIIKFLQKRYRDYSEKNRYNQTNQVINNLILIQAILYWFKESFSAWGYFHPSMLWSANDEYEHNKLFPTKNHFELPIVILHNPEAITYYTNKIFELNGNITTLYQIEIPKQLKQWKKWN